MARDESRYEPAAPPHERTTPSGAVAWAWEELSHHHARLYKAVDIGCGKGRNSLFLARKGLYVTAMDLMPNAIEALEKEAARAKVGDKIRALVQDVTEDWPIAGHETDLAVDSFCFKHLASPEEHKIYKANLLRTLNMTGHYLISLGSIGDGYYGRYVRKPDQLPMPVDDAVIIDPVDGIESPLYSREKIVAFFGPELEVYAELRSEGAAAKTRDDGVYALLFRRSPKWFDG